MSSFNEMCKTEYAKTIKKLMKDSLIKKILKEVKKLSRPYFETKVVKVKKENTDNCEHEEAVKWNPYNKVVQCHKCGEIFEPIQRRGIIKKKGNWVNGENLDEIKFPCFCRFDHRKGIFGGKQGSHGIGMINRTAEGGEIQYQLSWGDRQMENSGRLDILANLSVLCTTPSLKRLIELYDIHIRKGKIIIWEE